MYGCVGPTFTGSSAPPGSSALLPLRSRRPRMGESRHGPSRSTQRSPPLGALPARAGVRDELEALAAAERQCCAFVAWDVSQDGRHPVLHVTADPSAPDDIAPIAAMFGAD